MKKISQREARRLQRELARLENQQQGQRAVFARDYPGGVHILTYSFRDSETIATFKTARRLGHAIVATIPDSNGDVKFFAIRN